MEGLIRRITTGIRSHGRGAIKTGGRRSGTIVAGGGGGKAIITWRQCLFDAQRTTDKVCPSFVLHGWLRNDEFLDFMIKAGNEFKVASLGRDKVWNLISKRFEFDGIFGNRKIALREALVLTVGDALMILGYEAITQRSFEAVEGAN